VSRRPFAAGVEDVKEVFGAHRPRLDGDIPYPDGAASARASSSLQISEMRSGGDLWSLRPEFTAARAAGYAVQENRLRRSNSKIVSNVQTPQRKIFNSG
jgi:hypothetical protein